MENQLQNILISSAFVGWFLTIVSSGITLWIGFIVQAWVKNRIAKDKNENSKVLAEGTILREKTATGTRDGELAEFGDTHIRIDFDESSEFIPNDEFANSRFEIVKPGHSTMRTVPDNSVKEAI